MKSLSSFSFTVFWIKFGFSDQLASLPDCGWQRFLRWYTEGSTVSMHELIRDLAGTAPSTATSLLLKACFLNVDGLGMGEGLKCHKKCIPTGSCTEQSHKSHTTVTSHVPNPQGTSNNHKAQSHQQSYNHTTYHMKNITLKKTVSHSLFPSAQQAAVSLAGAWNIASRAAQKGRHAVYPPIKTV